MPSGENQLPFEEGDRLALVGGKAKGWQFGENLRTQMFGWFPIAYTNADLVTENKIKKERDRPERPNDRYENMHYERQGMIMRNSYHENYNDMDQQQQQDLESDSTYRRDRHEETSPTRMFGDTYRNQKKVSRFQVIDMPACLRIIINDAHLFAVPARYNRQSKTWTATNLARSSTFGSKLCTHVEFFAKLLCSQWQPIGH